MISGSSSHSVEQIPHDFIVDSDFQEKLYFFRLFHELN